MSDDIKKGLLGIVVDETEISKVMPEINSLTYRGYAAQDLCEYCRFEEVAYLILNKDLPNTLELRKFEKEEKNNRDLSKDLDMMVTDRGNNKTGWSNSAYDEILNNAASKISTKQRYELYEKAEKILIDELPVIPLYTYTRTYLLSERVKNWQNNILDTNPYQFLSLE